MFCWLEGDDALEPDVFKGVQEYITINNVDVNEAVGIFVIILQLIQWERSLRILIKNLEW